MLVSNCGLSEFRKRIGANNLVGGREALPRKPLEKTSWEPEINGPHHQQLMIAGYIT